MSDRGERAVLPTRLTALAPSLLAPLVSLFGLPGLDEFTTSSNSAPTSVKIILATAFASGIFANVFLLVRLLGRRALLPTLGALFCLVVRLLTNVAGTIVFAKSIREVGLPSQSIMPVVSIILAAFIIVLLTLDAVRTRWYKNGEGVEATEKQKSLNTAFTWFIFVLIVGTVVFRFLIANINFIDSMYFTIGSVVTTGFGDIVPVSIGARIFSIIFNTIGIISFAIVIIFINIAFLEHVEARFRRREHGVLSPKDRNGGDFKTTLSRTLSANLSANREAGKTWWKQCGKEVVQEKDEEDSLVRLEVARDVNANPVEEDPATMELAARDMMMDYEAEIIALKNERNREFKTQIVLSLLSFLSLWVFGMIAFANLESWSYFEGLYFSYIALTTIGYGDYVPVNQSGRTFFCVWILGGAPTLTILFTVIANSYTSNFKTNSSRLRTKLLKSLHKHRNTTSPPIATLDSHPLPLPVSIAPRLDFPSSVGSEKPAKDGVPLGSPLDNHSATEFELATRLFTILSDMQNHTQSLIDSNINPNSEAPTTVRTEVEDMMKAEGFATVNSNWVANSDNYLRYLCESTSSVSGPARIPSHRLKPPFTSNTPSIVFSSRSHCTNNSIDTMAHVHGTIDLRRMKADLARHESEALKLMEKHRASLTCQTLSSSASAQPRNSTSPSNLISFKSTIQD